MIPRFVRPLSRASIVLIIFSFWIIFVLTLSMTNIKGLMESKYKMYHDYGNWLATLITGGTANKDFDTVVSTGIAMFIVSLILMIYFIISYCFVHSIKRYKQKYAYISNMGVSFVIFLVTLILLFLNLSNGLILFLLIFSTLGLSCLFLSIASFIGCFAKTSYEFAANAKGE